MEFSVVYASSHTGLATADIIPDAARFSHTSDLTLNQSIVE